MTKGEYCIHGFSLKKYIPNVKRENEITAPAKDPYPIIPKRFPYASERKNLEDFSATNELNGGQKNATSTPVQIFQLQNQQQNEK